MEPKITLCIPIYRTPKEYLECLLDSISKQTYSNFKVLITDDSCSSSYTYDDLISKFSRNLNLTYIINEINLGMTGNWNKALSLVNTELFIFLGHDDALYPEALAELIRYQKELNASCVSSACSYINETGEEINPTFNINYRGNIFIQQSKYTIQAKEAVSLCLKNGIAFGELTCQLFELKQEMKYNSNFQHAADLDFFLKAISSAPAKPVGYINKKLFIRRLHSNALTEKNYTLGLVTQERQKIFDNYHKSFPFTKSEINSFKSYLIACTFKDAFTFPRHKSWAVLREALRAFIKNMHFDINAQFKLAYSIATGKNMDSR